MNKAIPGSRREALELLAIGGGPVVAGGTDLMVKRRRWAGVSPAIAEGAVYVANLSELSRIRVDAGLVEIGATATLSQLLVHPLVPALLKAAIRVTASPGIRNAATLAGNLANASPAADPALALACLDAVVRLESASGVRTVPVVGFSTGPGKTVLRPDELITAILVPSDDGATVRFEKVGGRKADAIAKVAFAGFVKVDDGVVTRFSVAFGAVGPTVVRDAKIEESATGLSLEELKRQLPRIRETYGVAIRPIDDQRSTADYRRTVALNLLSDFIGSL